MEKELEKYLPPKEDWPERVFSLPEYRQPERINVADALLLPNLEAGRGEKVAIYCGEERLIYSALWEKVNRLASSLRRLGIGKSDRVMFRFANTPEFIVSWLAVLKIGAICVSTMPLLRARELTYMANDSEARAVLVDGVLVEEIIKAAAGFQAVENIVVTGPAQGNLLSWDELIKKGQADIETEPTLRTDPAVICYTSGSTGPPKGALHFHEDLLNCAEAYAKHILAPGPSDIFGGHSTMAFTFGLGALLIFPLRFGGSTVLVPSFTPEEMLATIERYRITILFGTPTSYRMMLQKQDQEYDLSSLRICASAGEALPASVFHQWRERFGIEPLEHIGTTEMLYAFLSNRQGQVRPGSCGKPVPGYEVKVVDENFNPLPPGTPGLLAVKGPIGCRYWRKPERQKEYVRFDGWNFTGDMFTTDEEGYFYFQCRADDLIVSGGYNITGVEIEQTLMEHPAIAEAAVIGAPDPVRGQRVKAFVVLKSDYTPSEKLVEELQTFVKNTLAPYKYPREVEFVSSLPRTETGKVRRVELRERELKKQGEQK